MNDFNINLDTLKKVHFIGIGGISMSGLAEILIARNIMVSGSDANPSKITEKLINEGALINYGHSRENITEDIDLVVYTAAVKGDNEEILAAQEKNIKTMVRADFLGLIMKAYKTAIGISGTHGKTTTTSMTAHILMEGETDPTIMVGGILDSINGNIRIGKSETFLTEACEYTNSFHSFFPTIAVILNVCEDHMDFFNNIEEIRESFKKYANLVPNDGYIIINSDISNNEFFTEESSAKIIKFGKKENSADVYAENIKYYQDGSSSLTLCYKEEKVLLELNVTGEHNIYNALSAAAVGFALGIPLEKIKKGLESFRGTGRRFEYKGEFNGVKVIDDYAHHPDEIKATLVAARNCTKGEIWCAFQPHTYTRTKAFLNEFADTLALADHIVLADIYAAREKDDLGVSSKDILNLLLEKGKDAYNFHTFDEIEKFLKEKCINGDMLITMGAGNIVNIADSIIK